MKLLIASTLAVGVWAQPGDPERLAGALQERALLDQVSRLSTDQRILMYQKLSEAKSDNLHYRNLLAAAFILKTRETTDPSYLERAARVIDGVLSTDGRNYEALRLKNEVALENHNFKQVAEASRKLTQLAPEDPWNWGTLGDSLMEMGDYNGAAEAYQKMVQLRPDLSSYNRVAWYRYVAGDAPGAIRIMKMALEAGSRTPEHMAWCWVELGGLYLRTNQSAEASKAYATALKFMPNYHAAWAGAGKALVARGESKQAIEAFLKAQAITPMPDYAAALHNLYLSDGNRAEAQKQLALIDVIDKMGKAAQEKGNRALVYVYADSDYRLDRALQLARAELDIRQDIFTWDALAWALYKNKQYAEAEKAMEKALAMGTPEAGFHYHAGMIAAAMGKKAEAQSHLKKALELNPVFDMRQAQVARKKLEEVS